MTRAGSDLNQVRDDEGLVQLVYWQQQGVNTSKAGAIANRDFVLLAPQLPTGQRWDPDTVVDLIQSVAQANEIDTTRVAIAGHSLGSKGVWAVTEAYPSTFRAAIPISDGPDDFDSLSKLTKLPISAWFGYHDTVATNNHSVAIKAQERLESLGSTVSNLTVLPTSEGQGHFISNAVFNNGNAYVLQWLLDTPAT